MEKTQKALVRRIDQVLEAVEERRPFKLNERTTALDLSSSQCSSDDVKFLCQNLMENTSLKTLNLISRKRTEYDGVADLLEVHPSLQDLTIRPSRALSQICQVLKNNRILTRLTILPVSSAADLDLLSDLLKVNQTLKYLNIEMATDTTDLNESFKSFSQSIATNTTLEQLYLDVRGLDLSPFSESLKMNRSLKLLSFLHEPESGDYDEGYRGLYEGLKENTTLQHLKIEGGPYDGDQVLIWHNLLLQLCAEKMQSLASRYSAMSANCVEHFCSGLLKGRSLTELNLEYDSMELDRFIPILEVLQDNKSIRTLNLSRAFGHGETDPFMPLINLVRLNNTITDLNISSCVTDSQTITELCKVLGKNSTLTALNIRSAFRHSPFYDIQTYIAIGDMLKDNKTLRKLDMSHIHIGSDAEYEAIANGLKFNNTLTDLNIADNEISSKSSILIYEILKNNKALRNLSLPSEAIRIDTIKEIADLLQCNRTTTKLEFYGRGRGDETESARVAYFDALFEPLKKNDTLTYLDISPPDFYSRSEETKFQELKESNYTLTYLGNYSGNTIIQDWLDRNKDHQSDLRSNLIIIMHNILRSSDLLLPREICIIIFRSIQFSWFDVNSMVESVVQRHRLKSQK